MVLTGLGCLSLTQVSVDGSYLGDIFFGLLIFGPGLGAAYVAGSIASLAGVAEADAGLASGLNNSSFQIGGAVGVAILSTVAVSQADGADPLTALTNGFQSAFATAIVFAVVGLLAAIALLGKFRLPVSGPRRRARHVRHASCRRAGLHSPGRSPRCHSASDAGRRRQYRTPTGGWPSSFRKTFAAACAADGRTDRRRRTRRRAGGAARTPRRRPGRATRRPPARPTRGRCRIGTWSES